MHQVLAIPVLLAALSALTAAAQTPPSEPVRIAAVLPLSGTQAETGRAVLEGAREALAQLKERSPQWRFELDVRDDGGQPKRALALAQTLCAGKTAGVIGDAANAAALAAYKDCGLPVILAQAKPGVRASESAAGFDAVMALSSAMQRAGSAHPARYAAALSTLAQAGKAGAIHFDVPAGLTQSGNLRLSLPERGSRGPTAAMAAPPPPPPSPVQLKPELAPTAQPEAMIRPSFPWPPPRPSTQMVLVPKLLRPAAKQTLADLDARLQAALDHTGYAIRSYYPVPGGFALATRVERFLPDGQPATADERWPSSADQPGAFSFASLLKSLFNASAGHFRVIVFIVTPEPFATAASAASREQAEAWVAGGLNALPTDTAAQPWGLDVVCTALVYEFRKPPGGSAEAEDPPGFLPADTHLRATGLIGALQP